jgi:hypothetical protein
MSDPEFRARYLGVDGFALHSMGELARILGVHPRTVRRRLKRLGVRVRRPDEARDVTPPRAGWAHTPESRAKVGKGVKAWWAGLSPAHREAIRAARRETWWRRTGDVHARMRARAARAPKGRLRALLRAGLEARGFDLLGGEKGGADFLAVGPAGRWAVFADGFWRLQMPVERVLARVERCRAAGAVGVVRVCHAGRKTRPPADSLIDEIHKIVYNTSCPEFLYIEIDYGEGQ